jgi:hypothetical protein
LLHYAGESGFSRKELGKFALLTPPNVTKSLQRLVTVRQAIKMSTENYRLTDLGSKRVRDQLASKLVL